MSTYMTLYYLGDPVGTRKVGDLLKHGFVRIHHVKKRAYAFQMLHDVVRVLNNNLYLYLVCNDMLHKCITINT